MTPVSDLLPADVEQIIVAWLAPLGRAAITRRAGDPLPFRLVRAVAGVETSTSGEYVVSVRTLCAKAAGELAAAAASRETHARMLHLAATVAPVTLADGTVVGIDYLKVFEPPMWRPFDDDQILCKLVRYDVGLTFTRHPA